MATLPRGRKGARAGQQRPRPGNSLRPRVFVVKPGPLENSAPMKNFNTTFLFIFFAQLLTLKSVAQEKAKEKSADKKYYKFAINYQSDHIYSGRRDSIQTAYLTPQFGCFTKSGFYINGSLSLLLTESRVDLFTLEGGYEFARKHFDGSISVERYFYNAKSYNVEAEIRGSLIVTAGYEFKYLKPTVQADFNIGANADYNLTLGCEHTFYALDDNLMVTPSLFVSASTMNFYNSYFQKRRYAKTRKASKEMTANILNGGQFSTREIELSVPLDYSIKKVSLNFTPGYVIPVNPNTVQLKSGSGGDVSTSTFTEELNNVFYWSVGASFKF